MRVGPRPVAPEGYLRNSRPNPSSTRLDGPEGPTGGLMNNQAAHGDSSGVAAGARPAPSIASPARTVT